MKQSDRITRDIVQVLFKQIDNCSNLFEQDGNPKFMLTIATDWSSIEVDDFDFDAIIDLIQQTVVA